MSETGLINHNPELKGDINDFIERKSVAVRSLLTNQQYQPGTEIILSHYLSLHEEFDELVQSYQQTLTFDKNKLLRFHLTEICAGLQTAMSIFQKENKTKSSFRAKYHFAENSYLVFSAVNLIFKYFGMTREFQRTLKIDLGFPDNDFKESNFSRFIVEQLSRTTQEQTAQGDSVPPDTDHQWPPKLDQISSGISSFNSQINEQIPASSRRHQAPQTFVLGDSRPALDNSNNHDNIPGHVTLSIPKPPDIYLPSPSADLSSQAFRKPEPLPTIIDNSRNAPTLPPKHAGQQRKPVNINPETYLRNNIFDRLFAKGGKALDAFRRIWQPKARSIRNSLNGLEKGGFKNFFSRKRNSHRHATIHFPTPQPVAPLKATRRAMIHFPGESTTAPQPLLAEQKKGGIMADFLKNYPRLRKGLAISLAGLAGTGAISAGYAVFNSNPNHDSVSGTAKSIDKNPSLSNQSSKSKAAAFQKSIDTKEEQTQENSPAVYKVDTFNSQFNKYIIRLGNAGGIIQMLRSVSARVSVPEIKDPSQIAQYQKQGKLFLTGKESSEKKQVILTLAFLKQAESLHYQNRSIQTYISIHKHNLEKYLQTGQWQQNGWGETKLLLNAFQKPLRLTTPQGIIGYAPDTNPETNPSVEKLSAAPTFYQYFKKAAKEMQEHPTAKYSDPQTIGIETCNKLREMFKKVRDDIARGGLQSMNRAWCGDHNEKIAQPSVFSRALREPVAVYADGRTITLTELSKKIREDIRNRANLRANSHTP